MSYRITYDMAKQLLQSYIEEAYNGGPIVLRKGELCKNTDVKDLLDQLSQDGYNTDILIRQIKEDITRKKFSYAKLRVNVDGAARFNNDPAIPNKSASGFAIFADDEIVHESAEYIGSHATLPRLKDEPASAIQEIAPASNNTTEYIALIRALEYLVESGLTAEEIEIHSDSRMVVTQINMVSTTKATHLRRLRDYAHELMSNFKKLSIVLIPREENEYVDALVNELLDSMEEQQEKVSS